MDGDPTFAAIEARVQELEIRAAFAERTVDALDEVVRAFTVRVEGLEREVSRLKAQLAQGDPGGGGQAGD